MTDTKLKTPVRSMSDQVAVKPGQGLFMDIWYVAGRLDEVRPGASERFKICGRELVIARDRNDLCTATLVDGDIHVPCEISEDLIWVFIAEDPNDIDIKAPPPIFGGPKGKVRFMEKVVIPTHLDDAAYGLLDPAHTPFVHRSPFWRGNEILKEKRKTFAPSDFGFTMVPHTPVNSDIYKVIGGAITVRIAFRIPGLRAEYIENSKHTVLGLTALTPIDHENTHLRQIFYWNSPVLNLARPIVPFFAKPFLQQDVDIMTLRRNNLEYGGKGMLLGDSDRQFLWYLSLKKSWEACGHDPAAFENPLKTETLRWRT
ncbi:MAG: hypothetical protein AAGJ84_10000 [Pseudomonadota bacterium]